MDPQQPMGAPPGQGYDPTGSMPGSGSYPYPPEDVDQGKVWALLGYLVSPLWILPLVQRDNAFALFHAKQAMLFNIIAFILATVLALITFVTCGFGAFLYIVFFPLLYPFVMGIVYAVQGEYRPMPWFGHLAEKYFSSMVADRRAPR